MVTRQLNITQNGLGSLNWNRLIVYISLSHGPISGTVDDTIP